MGYFVVNIPNFHVLCEKTHEKWCFFVGKKGETPAKHEFFFLKTCKRIDISDKLSESGTGQAENKYRKHLTFTFFNIRRFLV